MVIVVSTLVGHTVKHVPSNKVVQSALLDTMACHVTLCAALDALVGHVTRTLATVEHV